MERVQSQFWWKVALVTAAIVLPFGTIIVIAIAAARARRAERRYAEWWRHRDLARAASRSNGGGRRSRQEFAMSGGLDRQ